MRDLIFASDQHRKFFERNIARGRPDGYHKALFYLLGVSDETRRHIEDLFDFAEDAIRPEGLTAGWQTSGTGRLCRLAFNLWNGYMEHEQEQSYTPYDLFACGFARYMAEGIRLRYPEYIHPVNRNALDDEADGRM